LREERTASGERWPQYELGLANFVYQSALR
jgi:hypothetical protein